MPTPPPGGRRSLVGDADRERLAALLREHYAQGTLSLDEFDRRIGIVLSARFTDELAPAVDDLPLLAAGPDRAPGQASGSAPGRAPGKRSWARGRRHAQVSTPGAGWLPTSERFRDPATGEIMRVWIDPADQSRHYVPEDGTT
jgi:uncharacterized protein DUF1707